MMSKLTLTTRSRKPFKIQFSVFKTIKVKFISSTTLIKHKCVTYRPLEKFLKKGVSQQEAAKRKKTFDQNRQDLISLVISNLKDYPSGPGRRSV